MINFVNIFKKKFFAGASVLTALTLGSYVMGLLRDRFFAQKFGAGRLLDIYNASFVIPDLLLNIFIAGALSAAFIPVFTSLWSDGKREEADNVATTVLHSAVFTMIIVGGLAFIFMPALANIITPGFSGEEKILLVKVTRVMLLSPLLFAVSNTFGNMLVSFERFFAYGLSPILYNLGIIAGVFISQKFGIGIYGLVIGTLFGAFLHMSVRIIGLYKTGFRLKFPIDFQNIHFRHILKLMLPKMLGHPVEQLTFLAFTNIASLMAAGSIAIVSFSRNFQSVPVSVFGISFSVAIFSMLSRDAELKNHELFMKNFWDAAKAILIFTSLSAVFFLIGGKFVIRIFLGGGEFGEQEILTTGKMLALFALSIPTESMVHLLARSFYAMKDTLTPVLMSVVGLGIILVTVNMLKTSLGIFAIPISFFAGSFLEIILLFFLLRNRVKGWGTPRPSPSSPS